MSLLSKLKSYATILTMLVVSYVVVIQTILFLGLNNDHKKTN